MDIAMASRPLICFYGDDFTGSTNSFAQFQKFGLTGLLLTKLPPLDELRTIARSVDVLGVAGLSRSMPVAELEAELRTVFGLFADLKPSLIQYKVCSTFNSSKTIGNIGRACEIAFEMFPGGPIAVAPAQPDFGRYTLFGHHFARASDGRVYRLDRHPTMAVHPVTPMSESSLRLNLLAQAEGLTVREVHLLDLRRAGGDRVATWGGEAMPQRVTVFDALANDDLETIADLILAEAPRGGPALCVGSGGMSYGIAVFLARRTSASARRSPPMPPVGAMLVVSGSCSRLTAEQIERAVEHGWRGVRVDPARLAHADALAEQQESVVASLSAGQSVVAYTASGTSDTPDADVAVIGAGLARIVEASLKRAGVRRLIVAGGDTSGYVVRALPVRALKLGAVVIENAVMCTTMSAEPWLDGVEAMLKGGQVGDRDLFERVRLGLSVEGRA